MPEKQNTTQWTFSPFSRVAKRSGLGRLKRVGEHDKCHTGRHVQPHTRTVKLTKFAFWHFPSRATTATKITFHLMFFFPL